MIWNIIVREIHTSPDEYMAAVHYHFLPVVRDTIIGGDHDCKATNNVEDKHRMVIC